MFKKISNGIMQTTLLLSLMASVCFAEAYKPIDKVNHFNWNYFSTLDKNGNIFFSPYSITTALSVVANGAEGQTLDEILKVLSTDSLDKLNSSYSHLRRDIVLRYNVQGRKLINSNMLLLDKKYAENGIDEDYKNVVERIYRSEVREADFSGNLEAEKKNIADWVKNKTNNFISNYKSDVNSDTVMNILNVVYFKGDWLMPFEAEGTYTETFTNRDSSTTQVKMMNQIFKHKIKYYEDGKYKSVELPYKEDKKGNTVAAMYIILPLKDSDLNIAESWNGESMDYKQKFLDGIKNASTFDGKLHLKLPKFELDINNSLVDILKNMGIKRAFTNDAEFFRMVNNASLKISSASHRAKVKVDEQGTEAAAVTSFRIALTSAMPIPKPEKFFCANRPFLFVIEDINTSVVLFTGVVNKL